MLALRPIVTLLTLTGLASACGKDKTPPTATIAGEVRILNEFGQPVATRSGIAVSTDGGSTQTNTTGQYELKIPTGKHTVTFEKPYLGTYRLIDQPLAGNVTQPLVTLGTQPPGVLNIAVEVESANSTVYVRGLMGSSTPQGQPPRKHRLLLHSGPVSPQEYTLTTSGETNNGDYQFFDVITFNQLRAAGFAPGQMIFIRAYGDNTFADTYTDPVTQRTIYPALSSYGSNSVNFTF